MTHLKMKYCSFLMDLVYNLLICLQNGEHFFGDEVALSLYISQSLPTVESADQCV